MRKPTGTTILTVDDNDALRYSLTRALQDGGYDVIEARNGNEAMNLANQTPDLITLDVHLPDIDGFEVCRRLKANPQTAHIPILHISATMVNAEDRIRGLEGGADAYLTEPIEREELLATVRALLRLKEAEREARSLAADAEKAKRELTKAHDELELRVEERTRELALKADEVRELTGRLLKLQDDERRHIARGLHDSVGQLLALISMNFSMLDREKEKLSAGAAQRLTDNEDLVQQVSDEIRTISHLLHPPLLDEVGLNSAIKWYVEGFADRSKIDVELELPERLGRLSSDQEISIFRIVQECLTNIHRHSESSTAAVRLALEDGSVRVEVKDAGVGIPPEKQVALKSHGLAGVGFRGMRERVRQLGGTFHIQSSDKGTTVTAVLPTKTVGEDLGSAGASA